MKIPVALVSVALLAASLSGCASKARATGMTITPAELVTTADSPLQRTVEVGEVGGGAATSPMWTSQVGNPEFREALVASLRLAGLLAEQPGRYKLKATLVSLDQPFFGFDMTVSAAVRYDLLDTKTGAAVWQDSVTTQYTATVGDAFAGVTRLRLANEGAVRKNIAALVEQLACAVPGPGGVN